MIDSNPIQRPIHSNDGYSCEKETESLCTMISSNAVLTCANSNIIVSNSPTEVEFQRQMSCAFLETGSKLMLFMQVSMNITWVQLIGLPRLKMNPVRG